MATSREATRDALATLLSAALVGSGLPCKTVSASKVETLEGATPLVMVLSRGSERVRLTFQGSRATFRYVIQSWVLQSADGWTQAQAEDAVDSIEALIAGVIEANQAQTNWETLDHDGQSSIVEAVVAGVPYYVETIPVVASLAHN
jgi:hypothetical protein